MAKPNQFCPKDEILLTDIIDSGKAMVFQACDKSRVKTGLIGCSERLTEEEKKRRRPKKENIVFKAKRLPTPAKICHLFRKYSPENFLLLQFDKCPAQMISQLLRKDIRVEVDDGRNRKVAGYRFFGHSPGQLREKKCLLYDTSLGELDEILQKFGDFTKILTVSKRAARIGLLLSGSDLVTGLEIADSEIILVEDVKRGKHNFTDGCGFISVECALKIVKFKEVEHKYSQQSPPVPSVFQIRFQGCKGTLIVDDPDDPILPKGVHIGLRDSLVKFEWTVPKPEPESEPEPHSLGVVDNGFSRPYAYGSLNKQYIQILSALGIRDEIFLKKQDQHFRELAALETSDEIAFKYLCAYEKFELAEKIIVGKAFDREVRSGLSEIRKRFTKGRSTETKVKDPKTLKLSIPIEMSRNTFGVCDPSDTLEENTCFFQPIIRGKPQVLLGNRVVVGKNPCYHPGDIRVLTCVDSEKCHHLVDCIVFPTRGKRPHFDEIAGSDLDGDRYLICWDPELFPKKAQEPTSYKGKEERDKTSISHCDLVNYFANYDTTVTGTFANLFDRWADIKGVGSPECNLLANLFNRAIDSAKTGEKVKIPQPLKNPPRESKSKFVAQKMKEMGRNFQNFIEDMSAKIVKQSGPESQESELFESLCNIIRSSQSESGQRNEEIFKSHENKENSTHVSDIVNELDNRDDLYWYEYLIYQVKERTTIEEDELRDILVGGKTSDFQLFRMLYKWCESRNRMGLMKEFSDYIDFGRFTPDQLQLVKIDVPTIADDLSRRIGLYSSSILQGTEIAELTRGQTKRWTLYYSKYPGEEMRWDMIHNSLAKTVPKLLVSKFLMGGQPWVIAITIPGSVVVNDVTAIPVSAFISVQGDKKTTPFLNDYVISLQEERLDIYPAKEGKGATFIFMAQELEKAKMSVALQKFSSDFVKRRNGQRLRKENIDTFEIFCMYADFWSATHFSPSLSSGVHNTFLEEEPENTPVNEFTHQAEDFPAIGEEAEEGIKATKSSTLSDYYKEIDLIIAQIDEKMSDEGFQLDRSCVSTLLAMMQEHPEVGIDVAKHIEHYMWKSPFVLKTNPDDEYFQVLIHLLFDSAINTTKIERFLTSLGQNEPPHLFTYEKFMKFLYHIIFHEGYWKSWTHINKFLKTCFQTGLFPLDSEKFKSQPARDYFLFWITLITIEIINDVESDEGSSSSKASGDIFFDEMGKVATVNIEGSNQIFCKNDGLAITIVDHISETGEEISYKIYAEIEDIIGMVLTINLIDYLDSQKETLHQIRCLTSAGGGGGSMPCSISKFPNLVTYRRMVEALRVLCFRSCSSDPGEQETMVFKTILETFSGEAEQNVMPSSSEASAEDEKLNESQKMAITAALNQSITLIQGPPGTGKTYTAALILKEWLKSWDHEPILACAETNEGVNNLIEKVLVLKIPPEDIVRVGSSSKVKAELDKITLEYKMAQFSSSKKKNKERALESHFIEKAKIVFCTCIGAGIKLLEDHKFTHVLVDEAGQALEPALLVPLSHGCTRLCLVGDDKQLPPLVKSSYAPELRKTTFERLREKKFEVNLLDTQYRMHPALAEFPSHQFYEDRLKNGVSKTERPPGVMLWPNKEVPIHFINMQGREKYDKKNSIYNEEECAQVLEIINQFLKAKVEPAEIGVITPYKAQKSKLEDKLSRLKVDVRTVDGFQGQEREIIVFSSVRANDNGLLGILKDDRRLNVLLTRAQRGLVVIGCRKVLETDTTWCNWLQWVSSKRLETQIEIKPEKTKKLYKKGTRR